MKEKLKNALIVGNLLLLGVLFFLNLAINLQLSPSMGPLYRLTQRMRGQSVQETVASATGGPVALPYRMAAVKDGEVCGLQEQEDITLLYDKVRPLLIEAVGSAEQPEKISAERYLALATKGKALRLEYDGEIPLYLFRVWANASPEGFNTAFSNLSICEDDNRIWLVFQQAGQAAYYRCATEAGTDLLFEILRAYSPNDVYFAGKDQAFSMLSADELIFPGVYQLNSYQFSAPEAIDEKNAGAVLEAFEMNRYQASPYQEADGAAVYVQGGAVLRFEKEGRVVFTQQNGEGGAEETKPKETVSVLEQIGRIISAVAEATDCVGDVSLKKIIHTQEGSDTLYLEYRIAGRPLGEEKQDWVRADIKGGKLIFLEFQLKKISLAEKTAVLPYQQAAAAVKPNAENLRFTIRYHTAEDKLIPYLSYATSAGER